MTTGFQPREQPKRLKPWWGEHACGHPAYVSHAEASNIHQQDQLATDRELQVCDRCRVDGKKLCGCGCCRQPEEYLGQRFPFTIVHEGIVDLPCPPIRNDPFSPPTPEFTAFQLNYATNSQEHPEWYCPRCKIHQIPQYGGTICAWCKAADPEIMGQIEMNLAAKKARKVAAKKGAGSDESSNYPL